MSNTAPDVECPQCGTMFAEESYFEMGEGSEFECPNCGAELCVSEVEMVMHWRIATKADYNAGQAKLQAYRDAQTKRFLEQLAERKQTDLEATHKKDGPDVR